MKMYAPGTIELSRRKLQRDGILYLAKIRVFGR